MVMGGFLIIPIVISLQAFPAYILQFLIVRFVGKQYRFILPVISIVVMLLFGIVLSFPALRMDGYPLLRLLYILITLMVFQIPTLLLMLVGKLAVKTIPEKSDVDKMKTLDLE
jgi:cytochrome b subunit of formate dehydrogenase